PATAGTPVNVSVTAFDPYGNRATGFTGTVHLSSSDTSAQGMGDYSFTAADQGAITIPLTFLTSGSQSVSVSSSGLTGDQQNGINVSPAVATQLEFIQGPQNTFLKTALPGSVTVQVEDQYGNPVPQSVPVNLVLQGNT